MPDHAWTWKAFLARVSQALKEWNPLLDFETAGSEILCPGLRATANSTEETKEFTENGGTRMPSRVEKPTRPCSSRIWPSGLPDIGLRGSVLGGCTHRAAQQERAVPQRGNQTERAALQPKQPRMFFRPGGVVLVETEGGTGDVGWSLLPLLQQQQQQLVEEGTHGCVCL